MLNGLDLFSGIGGLTIALEGIARPVAYCENDRHAQAVLLSRQFDGRLPIAPIWNDVRTLTANVLPSRIDIIWGGFPCQDISCAGTGKGLEGERSGLFYEIVRLVRDLRPKFVFLENVSAIVVRGMGSVLSSFTDIGYDCRWTVNRASEFGAPHHRARWWLLAHTNGEGPQAGGGIDDQEAKTFEHRIQETFWRENPDSFLGIPDGLPPRTHRIKALGNAVVPQQARAAFERLIGRSPL